MSNTIDITPTWSACAEIFIMVLQNKKASKEGLDNVFWNIRDMAYKLDEVNKKNKAIKKAQEGKSFEEVFSEYKGSK